MKKALIHVVLLSLFIFGIGQVALSKDSSDELFFSPEVQNYFYQRLSESVCGYKSTDAAWIIYENEARALKEWPAIKVDYKQVWNFPIPSGALAIVHTHPITDYGRPSFQDVLTAKKIRIPIYAISRAGFWKVTQNGSIIRIESQIWYKQMLVRFPCTDFSE